MNEISNKLKMRFGEICVGFFHLYCFNIFISILDFIFFSLFFLSFPIFMQATNNNNFKKLAVILKTREPI